VFGSSSRSSRLRVKLFDLTIGRPASYDYRLFGVSDTLYTSQGNELRSIESRMKPNIHPKYVETKVICACGETFTTRSTKNEIHVEICSVCHPFFTGKQKLIDTAGRVERFQRKYGRTTKEPAA